LRKDENLDLVGKAQPLEKAFRSLRKKDGADGQAGPHGFGDQVGAFDTGEVATT
jgi:hypothetical protein